MSGAGCSLPHHRHSHSLARLAAIEAARGSFDAATAAIGRRCGPVIGKRQVEQAGARWGLDGAVAVLKLRAVHSNNDFDAYWRYHVTREHEHLYQTADQAEYTLTA